MVTQGPAGDDVCHISRGCKPFAEGTVRLVEKMPRLLLKDRSEHVVVIVGAISIDDKFQESCKLTLVQFCRLVAIENLGRMRGFQCVTDVVRLSNEMVMSYAPNYRHHGCDTLVYGIASDAALGEVN